VARAIYAVSGFPIFNSRLPISSLRTINQLWAVYCVLSNFMDPILAKEGANTNFCCNKKSRSTLKTKHDRNLKCGLKKPAS